METHKIVYNNCYGGFGLSIEAIKWLENNATDESVRTFLKEKRAEIEKSAEPNLKKWITIEGLMETCLMYEYNEKGLPRHHKDLVACVEALGDKANGICSKLKIYELNENIYKIDEYDGWETVTTPKTCQWIYINEEE